MEGSQSKQKPDAGTMRITFPAPRRINLKPGQELVVNEVRATVRQTRDGQLEIDAPEFITELFRMGFRIGRNDSPQDLKRILENIPPQHRQDFLDGFDSK